MEVATYSSGMDQVGAMHPLTAADSHSVSRLSEESNSDAEVTVTGTGLLAITHN